MKAWSLKYHVIIGVMELVRLNANHLRNFRSDNLSQDKSFKEIILPIGQRKISLRLLKND